MLDEFTRMRMRNAIANSSLKPMQVLMQGVVAEPPLWTFEFQHLRRGEIDEPTLARGHPVAIKVRIFGIFGDRFIGVRAPVLPDGPIAVGRCVRLAGEQFNAVMALRGG